MFAVTVSPSRCSTPEDEPLALVNSLMTRDVLAVKLPSGTPVA